VASGVVIRDEAGSVQLSAWKFIGADQDRMRRKWRPWPAKKPSSNRRKERRAPYRLPTKPASAPVDDQVTSATGDRRRGSRGHSAARESRRRYARAAFPLPARADGSWMLPCRRIKSNSRRRALLDRLVASMERKLPGGSRRPRRHANAATPAMTSARRWRPGRDIDRSSLTLLASRARKKKQPTAFGLRRF
jgi:hypothetical protein